MTDAPHWEIVFLKENQRFRPVPCPKPQDLGDWDVLVKPLWVGICGSDLVAIEIGISDSLTLGHEWVGEVLRIGPKVKNLTRGDHVTSGVLIRCGQCEPCKAGRQDCEKQYYLTANAGMLRSEAVLPSTSLHKLNSREGANNTLIEILAVAENVHSRIKDGLTPQQKILIFGAGTLGLSTALVFQKNGYDVEVVEPLASRLERARALGLKATHLGTLLLKTELRNSYSVMIDASGDHLGSKGAWSYLEHFGQKGFLAVVLAKYIHGLRFEGIPHFLKEARLQWIQGCTEESLILAIENWGNKVSELGKFLITDIFQSDDVNEAFTKAREREKAGRVIIQLPVSHGP